MELAADERGLEQQKERGHARLPDLKIVSGALINPDVESLSLKMPYNSHSLVVGKVGMPPLFSF
jgi:hypothetical protein